MNRIESTSYSVLITRGISRYDSSYHTLPLRHGAMVAYGIAPRDLQNAPAFRHLQACAVDAHALPLHFTSPS